MKRLAFGLLFSLLAAGLAPGAFAQVTQPEPTDLIYRDQQLSGYITGSWYSDSVDAGATVSQDFSYAPGGTFSGVWKRANPQLGTAAVEFSGTWSVDGDTVSATVQKASNPALKVPFSERFQIAPVDADHLISTSLASGARMVFTRKPDTTEEHLQRIKEAVPDPGGDDAWVEFARAPAGTAFYDKRTLDRRGDIVGAWVRLDLSEAAIAEVSKRASGGQRTPTFKAIRTYSLIDCQRNLVRVRQIRITTSEGGDMTMNAPTAEPGRWERVDPDSYRNGGPGIACNVKP